jgi:hypothetical protein
LNWQQLQALLWLRWRLMANQWRRAGKLNAVLMMVATVGLVALAIPLFFICLVTGLYVIPKVEPMHLLFAWDGVIVAFLFFWMIGLITELQRTEPLSITKFLHLPVSVNGAFLINYLSSLLRISLIVLLPIMLGFCLAQIYVKGAMLLLVLPSLAAFVLMITALTYQFQGWLASLMTNPRRRRTVIVVTTTVFVLVLQLPNALNFFGIWSVHKRANRSVVPTAEMTKLELSFMKGEIDEQELARRRQELLRQDVESEKKTHQEMAQQAEQTMRLANQVLPIGWLPLGVMAAAEGRPLPTILGCLGMTLIGSASLWRAYRTTIRLYQGTYSKGSRQPAPLSAKKSSTAGKPKVLLLEWRLPGFSEPVSAIALGSLRSLLRSPEAKMMLLTLVILSVIFGASLLKVPIKIPDEARPLFAIGGMLLVLFGVLQLMSNQFGFDRDGFRVFVLCAARRRDILLGKNLAFAPLTLGMALLILIVLEFVSPLRIDHFLAMIPLYISMYLLFCLLANLISMMAPLHIAPGSFKPSNPKLKTILLQMVMFMFLFPLVQVPTLLPLGIEAGARHLGWASPRLPIFLMLSLAECAVIVWIYRVVLNWQGNLLQSREQKILDAVTNRAG